MATPVGFATLSWKYYLVWAGVTFSITPTVYFLYPETTGLSVEEIDQVFIDSPGVLSTTRTAREYRKLKKETGALIVEGFHDGMGTNERKLELEQIEE